MHRESRFYLVRQKNSFATSAWNHWIILPILNQETIETFKDEAEKEVMQELEEEQGE